MKLKKVLVLSPAVLAFTALIGCDNKPIIDPDWLSKDNWYELTNNATADDIGKTVKVRVNNQDHNVRLIGIDHDVDEKNNKLHTTWEFSNLICDKYGYSLAYQWNDTNDLNTANYDYRNSTIRYALNGTTKDRKDLKVLVAQKLCEKWDVDSYNKPVINMLPEGLRNKIKTVKKTVGVRAGKDYDYQETEFTDKLFMISTKEIGFESTTGDDKGFGTKYEYYKQEKSTKVKSQIKQKYHPGGVRTIVDTTQSYQGDVSNFAGQYEGMFTQYGSSYWLTAPYEPDIIRPGNLVRYCDETGSIQIKETYTCAFGIAPAFCI